MTMIAMAPKTIRAGSEKLGRSGFAILSALSFSGILFAAIFLATFEDVVFRLLDLRVVGIHLGVRVVGIMRALNRPGPRVRRLVVRRSHIS